MLCFYIETTTQSMLSDTGTVIDYLIILINKDIYAFDCQSVVFKNTNKTVLSVIFGKSLFHSLHNNVVMLICWFISVLFFIILRK